MTLLKNLIRQHWNCSIKYSTKPKIVVNLDEKVQNSLEKSEIKPRNHPGRVRPRCLEIPDGITAAIKKSVGDFPIKQLITDGVLLNNYLTSRKIPIEEMEMYRKRKSIQKEILQKMGYSKISEIDDSTGRSRQQIKDQSNNLYKKHTYAWKPIAYDDYRSLTYLFGRSAQEYSTVLRVFKEIAQRHPDFKPRSFFDFGAGVGTGTWAASELWKESLYEYFLVDTSREMNNLSDLILRGGDANKHINLKNVYYRQFLPVSTEAKFNLILSAYSLMELPNLTERLETLLTLWNKCDGYLVIIEQGTNAGFNLINEARDFLLDQVKENDSAYVFAPCPHHETCPRFKLQDGTPCNFESFYKPLRVGDPPNINSTLYSYLVLKKGSRASDDESINWPRLVRTALLRSQHTICRMCTHRGKLEEIIFTPSRHSKLTYQCTRNSDWGDRLPVVINEEQD